jgi:hypothetical protein
MLRAWNWLIRVGWLNVWVVERKMIRGEAGVANWGRSALAGRYLADWDTIKHMERGVLDAFCALNLVFSTFHAWMISTRSSLCLFPQPIHNPSCSEGRKYQYVSRSD